MKTLKWAFCALLITSIFSFSACNNDNKDPSDDGFKPGAKLIPEVIENDFSVRTHSYDNANRLVEVRDTRKELDVMSSYARETTYRITYNEAGKADSILLKQAEVRTPNQIIFADTMTFAYDGLKVLKKHQNRTLEILTNENGTVNTVQSLSVAQIAPPIIITDRYEYNETGDVKTIFTSWSGYESETNYEYDAKNGMLKHINTPQWLLSTQLFIGVYGSNYTTPPFGTMHSVKKTIMKEQAEEPYTNNYKYLYSYADYPLEIKNDAVYNYDKTTSTTQVLTVTKVRYRMAK